MAPEYLPPETMHFGEVFGTNTSFLELLLKKRGMKGPGWLRIRNARAGIDTGRKFDLSI